MAYFVVISEQGPAWVDSVPMREQGDWAGHAAFMNALAEDGFVVLGGPIGDGPATGHASSSGRVPNKTFEIALPTTPGPRWVY